VKRLLFYGFFGLVLLSLSPVSCVEPLKSSLGLKCTSDSDCWDNLSCKNELCGGERRPVSGDETDETDAGSEPKAEPKPEPRPEPVVPDTQGTIDTPKTENTATEPTPEPAQQCKGNLDAFGQCTVDTDCCPGQTCMEMNVPNVGTFKVCGSCSADTDCPMKTTCCPNSICASQCQAP